MLKFFLWKRITDGAYSPKFPRQTMNFLCHLNTKKATKYDSLSYPAWHDEPWFVTSEEWNRNLRAGDFTNSKDKKLNFIKS